MQINLSKYDFTDSIPVEMLLAYADAETSEAPCQMCKAHPEQQGKRVHFHGSDVGACPRKTYFTMTLGKQTQAVGKQAAFLQDGHLHERMMLEAIGKKFTVVAPKNTAELREAIPMLSESEAYDTFLVEKKVLGIYRTFLLIGHYDGLVVDDRIDDGLEPETKNVALIECKSVKEYTWKQVKAGEIKDEWYGQMQAYMWMMGISRCYLLVKNRATSEMLKPIRIDFDAAWMLKKLKLMNLIYKCVNTMKEVPKPAIKKGTDGECKFCPFNNKCYS